MASRLLANGEMILHGLVGKDDVAAFFGGDSAFGSADVVTALAEHGSAKDLTVRINSPGGDPFDGIAIYNALKAHKGKVTVVGDGIVASAASLIAMAGSPTLLRPGSIMMIHDPSAMAMGTQADMLAAAGQLDTIAGAMAEVYAEKSGRSIAKVRADMAAESWMSTRAAIKAKYADGAMKGNGKDDESKEDDIADDEEDEDFDEDNDLMRPVAACDYRLFKHAPKRLVALAEKRGWVQVAALSKKPNERRNNVDQKDIDRATTEAMNVAAQIITAANDAGVAVMASVLLKEGLTLEQALTRIDQGKQIKAKVAQARKISAVIDPALADTYIAAGATIDYVGSDLLDRIARAGSVTPSLGTHSVSVGMTAPDVSADLNPTVVYARRAQARRRNKAEIEDSDGIAAGIPGTL